MKVPFSIFIVLMNLASLLFVNVSGSAVYVDNTATLGTGTQVDPYSSITQALEEASISSSIDTIVLTSGQTFADLAQSFTLTTALTFTSSDSTPAQITLSHNAQITFSTAAFSFTGVNVLFSDSGLSTCSILASNQAELIFSQASISASTTVSQQMPLICAESTSKITIKDSSKLSSITSSQDLPLLDVTNLSTLTINTVSIPNLKLLGSASLIKASLSSTVIIQSTSITDAEITSKAIEIHDSSLSFTEVTGTNIELGSGNFIHLVANTEETKLSITSSQFSAIASSSTGGFLTSLGKISNIALETVSFENIELPAGFASVMGLGTQFTMDAVTMKTINSVAWFWIESAALVEVSNSQFGNSASDFGSAFVIHDFFLVNFTLSTFDGIFASKYPAALLVKGSNETVDAIISEVGPVSFSQGFYVTSCVFKNLNGYYDDARIPGGSFFINTQTPAQVDNSTFLNNTFRYEGFSAIVDAAPCIYVSTYDNVLWISNSYFSGNRARTFSNCIWAYALEVIIVNSIIEDNTPIVNATEGDDPIYGNGLGAGGGVLLTVGRFIARNTTFQRNMRLNGADIAVVSTSQADILFATSGRHYLIDECTFINSTGVNGGNVGLAQIAVLNITISNSKFVGTTYTTGGAVVSQLIQNSKLYLINNTFSDFVGTTGGGFIHASRTGGQSFEIINCTFSNIQNSMGGAGIFLLTGTTLKIQSSVFVGIKEYFAGSVLYSTGSEITMDNCTYSYGFATIGGIYLSGSKLTITNSNFDNLMTMYDGALFLVTKGSTLYAENITATNIQTYVSGAIATVMEHSIATILNLNANGVQGQIGALFYVGESSTLKLDTTAISMVDAQSSVIYVLDSSFLDIQAMTAQAILGGTFLSMTTNSSLTVNTLTLNTVQCSSQTSICGISLDSTNSATITSYTVQGMSALGTFGALGLYSSKATITSSSISYVSTPSTGSCIMIMNSDLSVTSTTFTNLLGSCIYAQGGGNILKIESSTFDQPDSTFVTKTPSGNPNQQKPFIECEGYIDLTVFGSSFSNNYVSGNGGAVMINGAANNPSVITIYQSTTFSGNTAVNKGGAISLTNTKGSISDSSFINNFAEQSGGALHYNSSTSNAVSFTSNTFQNNKADVAGGVLFIEDGQLSIQDSGSLFSANQAGSYGNKVASTPVRLGAYIINEETAETLYSYSAGGSTLPALDVESTVTTPYNFTFIVLDQFDQVVSSLSNAGLTLSIQRTSSYSGHFGNYTINPLIASMKDFYFVSGRISIKDLIVSSIVPDTLQLQVSVPFGVFTKPTTFTYASFESYSNDSYNNFIVLNVIECNLGESRETKIDKQYCRACPSGTYSFNASDGTCNICPESAICHGGANTSVKSGFWRGSNYSIKIYKCLVEGACPQGIGYDCELGYEGTLCQTCSQSQRTYKTSGGQCLGCPQSSVTSPVFLFAGVGYILYFSFNIWVNIKAESDQMVETKGYLRLLNGFFQLYSIAINGEFPVPARLIYVFDVLSVGEASRCASLFDCGFENSSYPFVYVKAVFLCVLPLMCLGFFAIFFTIVKLFRKSMNLKAVLRMSSLTLLQMLIPGLSKQLLLSLNCTTVGDKSVSSLSYAFECNESRFIFLKFVFVLPCFFLWCVIIPGWSLLSTHQQFKKAAGDESKLPKMTLQIYKKQLLDWDAIIYARYFVLGLISGFLGYDYYNKALLTLGVLGISFYLTESYRPYRSPHLNFFALLELSIAIVTVLGAIYSSSVVILKENLADIAFYTIFLLNAAFVVSLLTIYIRSLCKKKSDKYKAKPEAEGKSRVEAKTASSLSIAIKAKEKFVKESIDLSQDEMSFHHIPMSPVTPLQRLQERQAKSADRSPDNRKEDGDFDNSLSNLDLNKLNSSMHKESSFGIYKLSSFDLLTIIC